MTNGEIDDLYTALGAISIGLVGDIDAAEQLASTLRSSDEVRGVLKSSQSFRTELERAGRSRFQRIFASVRDLLCDGHLPRPSVAISTEAILLTIEAAGHKAGYARPELFFAAKVIVVFGLHQLCAR